jgi:hypothetical protein
MRRPADGVDPEAATRAAVEAGLRAGRDVDEVVDYAAGAMEDHAAGLAVARAHAKVVVERLVRESAAWPDTTDCDRLDDAFADLERAGVVARKDFTCCRTCAMDEIADEMDMAEGDGVDVRGFAFFHQQDTERAVAEGRLFIGFGPRDRRSDSPECFAVGRAVVDALRARGLRAAWDGGGERRIEVVLDWNRRGPWWTPPVEPPPLSAAPTAPPTAGRDWSFEPIPVQLVFLLCAAGVVGGMTSPRAAFAAVGLLVAAAAAARHFVLDDWRRGVRATEAGRWAEGERRLVAAVERLDELWWADWGRAIVFLSLRTTPYRATALALLAHCRLHLGDEEGAARAVERLARDHPESPLLPVIRKRLRN